MMTQYGGQRWVRWSLGVGLSLMLTDVAGAHREVFTLEQREHLKGAERIYLEALALTDRGAVDAADIASVTAKRLSTLGYTVVQDPAQPHDVALKVKCEERKTWDGPLTSGGDADQFDAASRLWKGPACQITYRVNGQSADWRHEMRGDMVSAIPNEADTLQGRPKAIAALAAKLGDDPFPFLLAGAWNQPSRLLKTLDDPTTPAAQKVTIVTLLGDMSAAEAIPALSRTLQAQDPALVQSASLAMGAIGHQDCIPILLDQLKQDPLETRLAAIKGLGRLAPLHPNSDIVPALLARLPREPVPAQTEIVRALGKTTDRRILEPLRALNRSVQEKTRADSDPELKELKRALGQSLDQFDGVHTEE